MSQAEKPEEKQQVLPDHTAEQQESAASVQDDTPAEQAEESEKTGEDALADSPKKKKRTAKSYAISFFLKLAVTAAAAWALLTFVAGICICHTNSAYPMIKDGDFCLFYRLDTPSQGDEIVYRVNGELRFGRVIAKAGDSVEIFSDYITVNGLGLYENTVYPTSPQGASVSFPYTVPDKCIFVLNDYRSDINDSRTLGGIPLSDVEGTVIFIMRRRGI